MCTVNAEAIARALGGRKVGNVWMARCPAHDDRMPSLSIRNAEHGKVLVHCHAGCDQMRVIAALRSHGLWKVHDYRLPTYAATYATVDGQPERNSRRTEAALTIWRAATPVGALVETYLASRSLQVPLPPTLRFHAALKHHPSGENWPAMIALVTLGTDDTPLAIHRTYLARDGSGKAPVDPPRMMLGPCGGGAVRLTAQGDVLMIGEGIETCLAAMVSTGKPAWAALSASGLRALNLPAEVRDVIVLADGDETGEAAARDCALRWKRQGRRVRIARPPVGMDFNDLLLSANRIEKGA
jgi:putative DNA primase/helicase